MEIGSCYIQAVKGLELMKKYNVKFSVIATVSKEVLSFAEEVFDHLVSLGFRNISYSPVFDSPCGDYPSITNDEWLNYLERVFRRWFELGDAEIQIREINEVVSWISKSTIPCCSSLGTCARWFVVDPWGNVYPCEKLGRDVCFGNVVRDDFETILGSLDYKAFVLGRNEKPEKCRCCKFFRFCHNGCRQMRVKDGQFNAYGLYGFCEQRKALFQIVDREFKKVLYS